jgi:hypothetical protein
MGSGQTAFDLEQDAARLVDRRQLSNYKQVIPSDAKERVTLERETFLNSLRRVSLLASDKSNSIKLNFSKNNIDITANTPEVGEAKESLAVVYKGRDFSITFNPEFLMAPLRNLNEDEVFLDLIDEMSPGVLKIQTPFLYVLMPMHQFLVLDGHRPIHFHQVSNSRTRRSRPTKGAIASSTAATLILSILPSAPRTTCTFSFSGAHASGSLGPKSKMQSALAAAAKCEMPLSCPIKTACSNTAASSASGKCFAN